MTVCEEQQGDQSHYRQDQTVERRCHQQRQHSANGAGQTLATTPAQLQGPDVANHDRQSADTWQRAALPRQPESGADRKYSLQSIQPKNNDEAKRAINPTDIARPGIAAAVQPDVGGMRQQHPVIGRIQTAQNVGRGDGGKPGGVHVCMFDDGWKNLIVAACPVGQVAGQILAYHLLGEQVVHVENRIKFVRLKAGSLVGKHPWRSEALERTGAKIVAVEREHEVMVEFDRNFVVQADDALYVCGSVNSLERYQREFQAGAAPQGRG